MIALFLFAAATGQVEADVLVRAVARGETVRAGDFERRSVPAAQTRFALRAEDAIGKEARRMLPAGVPLRASDVAPPTLVHRGDTVTLSLRSGPLSISAPGRALDNAGGGEVVRVVNLATSRTLDGRVRAAGEVEVSLQ